MRLLGAELLALRKRAATYVVLGILLVVMTVIYVLAGAVGGGDTSGDFDVFRFPAAYGFIAQFVFGLGSLLAVAYAGAVAGGDWNWGIPRLVLSRGESRTGYVLTKAGALAVVLAVGVLISFGVGIVLTLLAATMSGTSFGDPIGGNGPRRLVEAIGLGLPVLLERAAIGFLVATLLRSQVAGIVVGIVLYIAEPFLTAIVLAVQLGTRFGGNPFNPEPIGPEWFQFLPFSVGNDVLSASNAIGPTGVDLGDLLLRPVPLDVAFTGVMVYLVLAIALSVFVVRRSEITV